MLLGIQNIILLVQLVKEHDGKWRYPSASQAKPSIVVSNDSWDGVSHKRYHFHNFQINVTGISTLHFKLKSHFPEYHSFKNYIKDQCLV